MNILNRLRNASFVTVVTSKIKYKMIHPPEGMPRKNFQWEPLLTKKIEEFEEKNNPIIFYDVGSAFGIFSKLVALLDSRNKVYAFEPYTPRWLTNILNTFFCHNHHLYKKYISNEVRGNFTTLAHFSKVTNTIPDLIKMDIEGGEYEALLAAEDWLKEHKPTIFLEFHENIMKNSNKNPQVLRDLFERIGYSTYKVEHHDTSVGNYVLELKP